MSNHILAPYGFEGEAAWPMKATAPHDPAMVIFTSLRHEETSAGKHILTSYMVLWAFGTVCVTACQLAVSCQNKQGLLQ